MTEHNKTFNHLIQVYNTCIPLFTQKYKVNANLENVISVLYNF